MTPVGKVIRAAHVDELPQLFNILKGEMSLVGPRPEWKTVVDKYVEVVPEFALRTKVKAGLTGYAQVYGNTVQHLMIRYVWILSISRTIRFGLI